MRIDPVSELVSVIVPAFNAAPYLALTLDSIARQTHQHLEVIVVDDGSTDTTAEIARAFARRDRRFCLLQQDNRGVASARNRAIEAARGRLIAPCDSDDLWTRDKLQLQLAAWVQSGPRTGLVYCWSRVIDAAGRVVRYDTPHNVEGNALAQMCRGNLVGNGSAPLMLRQAVLACGGYDPGLQARGLQGCEDLKLYAALAAKHDFGLARHYCVDYRHTVTNMSSNWRRMLASYDLVSGDIARAHPEYRDSCRLGRGDLQDWLRRRAVTDRGWARALAIHLDFALRMPVYAHKTLYWTHLRPKLTACRARQEPAEPASSPRPGLHPRQAGEAKP